MTKSKSYSVDTLRQSFLVEAKEHLESIRYFLQHSGLKQAEAIYRELHNLKGSSKAAGFDDVAILCHRFEDVFAELCKLDSLPDSNIRTLLLKSVEVIGNVISGADKSFQLEELGKRLSELDVSEEAPAPAEFAQSIIVERAVDALMRKSQSKVSLAAALENLSLIVRDRCFSTGKKVNFEIVGDAQIDPRIASFIKAPLNHIVGNCVEHGVELPAERLSLGKEEAAFIKLKISDLKEKIEITVCDDGSGVDTEKISRIAVDSGLLSKEELEKLSPKEIQNLVFDANFSTVLNDLSLTSGRGLGLAIAGDIIRQLGGSIALESKTGSGTSIKLTFEGVIDNNLDKLCHEFKKKLVVSDLKAKYGKRNSCKKILLVEDTKTQAILLERLLGDGGYEVDTVTSAEEATKRLQISQPDVCLIDINLPDSDGYELIDSIQSLSDCKHLPALVLSSNYDDSELSRFLESKASGIVFKQFDAGLVERFECQIEFHASYAKDLLSLEIECKNLTVPKCKLASLVLALI